MQERPPVSFNLTLQQVKDLSERGNLLPLVGEMPSDLLTPVSAFLRLADHRPHAFLLESVEAGQRLGRYSFLGCDPWRVIREDRLPPAGKHAGDGKGDPLAPLRAAMGEFRQVPVEDLPPFTGGAVGCLAYDAVRALEHLPDLCRDDLAAPDLEAGLYDAIVAFDHLRQRIQIVANIFAGREERTLSEEYARAHDRIVRTAQILAGPLAPSATPMAGGHIRSRPPSSDAVCTENMSESAYLQIVAEAKEEIARGEIFQVVLSRRIARVFEGSPFSVYRALRAINPSPYNYYLRHGERAAVGASPEMLVRVRGRRLELRPIAGTRPRGIDEATDLQLARTLMDDAKENAEHLMLVDLGRNDAGRVSKPGTVEVVRFRELERYSHVMHLVSSIESELAEDRDAFDALLSSFPAGTVSGAPKVRAMEIIERLEPTRRGPYAGAVFYRGFDGALDSAIAIRQISMHRGMAYVQSGAGIVADSDPAFELRETQAKAGAALAALERAETLS